MWYLKCENFAFPDAKLPTPNLKFALAPTPNPDASQWNIAGKMLALAMYISCFLCRFHLRLYPTRTQFPVEYGLKVSLAYFIQIVYQSIFFFKTGSLKVIYEPAPRLLGYP